MTKFHEKRYLIASITTIARILILPFKFGTVSMVSRIARVLASYIYVFSRKTMTSLHSVKRENSCQWYKNGFNFLLIHVKRLGWLHPLKKKIKDIIQHWRSWIKFASQAITSIHKQFKNWSSRWKENVVNLRGKDELSLSFYND